MKTRNRWQTKELNVHFNFTMTVTMIGSNTAAALPTLALALKHSLAERVPRMAGYGSVCQSIYKNAF